MTNRTTWQPPASSTTQSTAPTRAAWLGKIIWWLANNAVNVLSAEFLLKLGRPNGGTLILIRSAWISITLYGVALALQSGTYARWTWELWNWRFSLAQLSKTLAIRFTGWERYSQLFMSLFTQDSRLNLVTYRGYTTR